MKQKQLPETIYACIEGDGDDRYINASENSHELVAFGEVQRAGIYKLQTEVELTLQISEMLAG